jgi:methionyl-tRNA formyltransferase
MKTVFFCGHESPYGLAHLEPVLRRFEVIAVVAATNRCWEIFHCNLVGQTFSYRPPVRRIAANILEHARRLFLRVSDINSICRRNGITLLWCNDVNQGSFLKTLEILKPELILCAAYPQVFSGPLLTIAKKGAINFHPSLLPKFRGAHPHYWAIATGAEQGGLTAHFMTESLDAGPVIAQIPLPIGNLYYSEYYRTIVEHTPLLVGKVAEFLSAGKSPIPQIGEGSYFRNDREIHHRIFWRTMTATTIWNLIRSERAFCSFRGRLVWARRADLLTQNRNMTNGVIVEPGTIIDINEAHIVVAARNGFVGLTVLSNGMYNTSFKAWVAHHRARIGETFA